MLFLFVVSHGWKILYLLASVLLWLYELPWSVVEKACTDCVYVNVLVDHMVARRRGWFYDHWRCLTESITSRALDLGPVSRLRQLGSKHYQLLVVNDSNFSWRLYFAHIDLLHRLRGEGGGGILQTCRPRGFLILKLLLQTERNQIFYLFRKWNPIPRHNLLCTNFQNFSRERHTRFGWLHKQVLLPSMQHIQNLYDHLSSSFCSLESL